MATKDEVTKGIAWLSEQVEAKLGQAVEQTKLRVILRKLVNDGEIERGDGRWSFTGLKDPAVVAVFKAIKEGATADKPKPKTEGAKPASAKRRTSRAKAKPEPEVEDEDVLEDDELDLD
ncbi:hypothetical protein SEA_MSCARN_34 [Gordonia phage MScarn]|uniref:Uncharacterized protein n=2 Tax=Emalynvirus troje TaxID=2560511 RepID=A0A8F3ED30_9CAUD|nr:hypothetical protein SEA_BUTTRMLKDREAMS_33 [Gordonia phage Buttrmlkdreams]QWY84905.1 hypothetical protein SEA_MSCARN_34 [Gordonia phage MScarn]WKW85097.1 helix-turn-helix DNA binding domain protein [Gordonia phage Yummy]WKW86908.1 helix-turn-helix DNA binding domain protein [Gordonia phage Horseradish]